MNLSELLAKADLPGDLEFKDASGNTFKLADLRGFGANVETERTALLEQKKKAEQIGKEAQDLLTALQTAMTEVEKAKPKPEKTEAPDWRKNPLYEELAPVIDSLEQQVRTMKDLADSTKKSLDLSQAIYATERLRREWAETKVKPKGTKFEDAVKAVLERKDVDSLGMPTLTRWLNEVSEPDRIKTAVDEAVAKAKSEWELKTRISSAKPGSGTRFTTKKAGEPPIKRLDELTSEKIADDPDIAKAMEGGEGTIQ